MNKIKVMGFIRSISILIFIIFFSSCNFNGSKAITASGTIEIIETNVSSKNNDQVEKLLAEEGDFVKQGDVIAVIAHSILDLQLTLSKSNFNNAEIDYNRIIQLFSKGNASQKDRDDSENRYIVSKSTYEITKKQIEDCSIKAPVDGIITHKFVEVGEFVSVGSPVYSISKIDPVNLMIYLTEIELGKVKVGEKAKIIIDSYPKRTFSGKIIYISPNAEFTPKNIQTKDDRVKLVFGVKIEIPNEERILKPGLPADAIIE